MTSLDMVRLYPAATQEVLLSKCRRPLFIMVQQRKLLEDLDEAYTSSSKSEGSSKKQLGFDCYPASKVYRLIEPGPVLLVSTGSLADSTHNVMTIGFHMVSTITPSDRHHTRPMENGITALKKNRGCVLAVPNIEMAGGGGPLTPLKFVAFRGRSGCRGPRAPHRARAGLAGASIITPL